MIDRLFGISTALASEASMTGAESTMTPEASPLISLLVTFAPMILIFVVFYFILIRPQRKKDKQVKEMLNNLKAGDRVCTIGGIYGTIVGIKDDTVTLAVGRSDTNMVIARWGIRNVEDITVENDAQDLN